jgi:LacI family transcriptional regulator
MVDQCAIGRLGAEHLLERGLRRLAFFGDGVSWFARQRRLGFVERAKQAGVSCDVLDLEGQLDSRKPWQRLIAPLERWLQGLKTPIGLMATHDHRARLVLDECLRLGLNVPHDVAIVGSDDEPTVCEVCHPTLSSVARNAWKTGYQAAALLDRMMSGKSPPKGDILIPPGGVVKRQSTDTLAIDDPDVAAAVHYIHDHLGKSIDVTQMMRHMSISRRELELRFRQFLDCTPHAYLVRARVEQARQLLGAAEHVKLNRVAVACGFGSVQRLGVAFRLATGMTPTEYRQRCLVEKQPAAK